VTQLFEGAKKSQKADDYSAKDIEVLEGLESVRRRPGMYIGGTDSVAYHHMAIEIIDNAMDEALAGFADTVYVTLLPNNVIQVRDNGRGIPVDDHPKFPGKSALEVIVTTLHSGGKFKEGAYEVSGGLHGVGLSVVNALSDTLKITVFRGKDIYVQTFSKGLPTSTLTQTEGARSARGTLIEFHPDTEIFDEGLEFSPKTLFQMVRSKAYLLPGVKVKWKADVPVEDPSYAEATFLFQNGISDFLASLTEDKDVLRTSSGRVKGEGIQLDWALSWCPGSTPFLKTYCNTVHTPLGGTHESAFRSGLLKSIKTFAELVNEKRADKISAEDVFCEALCVLSAFVKNPQFQGQTKDKLVSSNILKPLENLVRDYFDHYFIQNKELAQTLLHYFIENAEQRLERKDTKNVDRASLTKRVRLPGKLIDCSKDSAEGTEIFIVEGDSAGGSAKQARLRQSQAILPLRGKIMNVMTSTADKISLNQEIQILSQALGCGTGKQCDILKLRYERVIIMTDADVDGAHIASLLMVFFFQHMRPIVESGRLYLAQPPLYKMSAGTTTIYVANDEDREKHLKTTFKKFTHVTVNRFKGLGEMNPEQLKTTTMDPTKRSLIRILVEENETVEDFVSRVMGKDVSSRLSYIEENALFFENLA
jgi:topoisomerase-4 subunit B